MWNVTVALLNAIYLSSVAWYTCLGFSLMRQPYKPFSNTSSTNIATLHHAQMNVYFTCISIGLNILSWIIVIHTQDALLEIQAAYINKTRHNPFENNLPSKLPITSILVCDIGCEVNQKQMHITEVSFKHWWLAFITALTSQYIYYIWKKNILFFSFCCCQGSLRTKRCGVAKHLNVEKYGRRRGRMRMRGIEWTDFA